MAEKSKKKGSGQGAAKKADADEAPKKAEEKSEKAEKAEVARSKDEHHDRGHGDAANAGGTPAPPEAHAAHGHKPNIREYFVIFAVLAVLTVIEVGVTKVPGINHSLMALALVGLALTKASIVGLYYMHLKHETQILKLTVALPVAAPAVYALVLMSEAAWRLAR